MTEGVGSGFTPSVSLRSTAPPKEEPKDGSNTFAGGIAETSVFMRRDVAPYRIVRTSVYIRIFTLPGIENHYRTNIFPKTSTAPAESAGAVIVLPLV